MQRQVHFKDTDISELHNDRRILIITLSCKLPNAEIPPQPSLKRVLQSASFCLQQATLAMTKHDTQHSIA